MRRCGSKAWSQMRSRAAQPSAHVRRPSSLGRELLEEMRQKGLEPDVITSSAAISACEKTKQSQRALELLEEMRQEGREIWPAENLHLAMYNVNIWIF